MASQAVIQKYARNNKPSNDDSSSLVGSLSESESESQNSAPKVAAKPSYRADKWIAQQQGSVWFSLPGELRCKIFGYACRVPELTTGVVAFGLSCWQGKADVAYFLNNFEEGRVLKALLPNWHEAVDEAARQVEARPQDFRRAFEKSAKAFSAKGLKSVGKKAHEYEGVCISLGKALDMKAAVKLLSKVKGKPVKLDARSAGKDRILSELLPLLDHVDSSCLLILDLSLNEDMGEKTLVQFVQKCKSMRNIYSIDLSCNMLINPEAKTASTPVVSLLAIPNLRRLYLANTYCNDATAIAMAAELAKQPPPERLDLRYNKIGDDGVNALLTALAGSKWCNPHIVSLRLTGNVYDKHSTELYNLVYLVNGMLIQSKGLKINVTESFIEFNSHASDLPFNTALEVYEGPQESLRRQDEKSYI